MASSAERDLVILVADKNMEAAIRGMLSRPQALRIRPITFDVFVHPHRDPGCLLRGANFLRAQASAYLHTLVILDRSGCGRERLSAEEIEERIARELRQTEWRERGAVIALDPELEVWVWSDSPHVDDTLGWSGRLPSLREWLAQTGLLRQGQAKPHDPKEALELALREVKRPRSSSYYKRLAETVSFDRCTDRAFVRLRAVLSRWFGE